MDFLSHIFSNILPFLVVLSIIVFIHEFGHYIVAKLCGVKVEAFSIGFGKEICGWNDKSGTRWKISWLPLGGYVKMFGDINPASAPDPKLQFMNEDEKKQAFHYKSLWKKALIVAAGPFANFVLAVAIMTAMFTYYGKAYNTTEVGTVLEGSVAAKEGLRQGDRIISIDGSKVESFADISRIVSLHPEIALEFIYQRDGKDITKMITPALVEQKDLFGNKSKIGRLGIGSTKTEQRVLHVGEAFSTSITEVYNISASTFTAIGQMITGHRGTEDLGGPIRIAQYSAQAYKQGVVAVLWLMVILSVNLGLVNLFPIPMLDGGHLMYYAIEAVRGKPMAQTFQEYGFRFGLLLLLGFFVFVTINDILSLFGFFK